MRLRSGRVEAKVPAVLVLLLAAEALDADEPPAVAAPVFSGIAMAEATGAPIHSIVGRVPPAA